MGDGRGKVTIGEEGPSLGSRHKGDRKMAERNRADQSCRKINEGGAMPTRGEEGEESENHRLPGPEVSTKRIRKRGPRTSERSACSSREREGQAKAGLRKEKTAR